MKVGDKAPDFTLEDTDGNEVSLSDFRGKKVVLYFYPKDDTPGCTREACDFRDNYKKFTDKAVILGVSLDDKESHEKFRDKYNLPFMLLCDTDAEVSKKYGVYGKKKFAGNEFMGITRTTFIIDENGILKHIFNKVKPKGHVEEVIEVLEKV